MPSTAWSNLNHLQLGRYAEYYAKMEFASYGYEVYTSEVDDHGVDFIAKLPNKNSFLEIQVKAVRDFGYVYITKAKMPKLSDSRLVCYLNFTDGALPDVFVIPASVWKNPNGIFVDRAYDKPGQKSAPEWGIQVSRKNYHLLEEYRSAQWFDRASK